MKQAIHASLTSLGLTEKEAAVYEALLQVKRGTPASLSPSTHIKRPTLYHVLEPLKEKGLIQSTTFRGVRDYRALPPETLRAYIRNQKRLTDDAIEEMQQLYEKRKQKMRLRVYHDLLSLKTFLEKSLRERARMYILGNEAAFSLHLGIYWEYFLKRSAQLGIRPKWKSGVGDIHLLLWSDKVAFVEFGDDPKIFGLKNKKMHDLYQHLWKQQI